MIETIERLLEAVRVLVEKPIFPYVPVRPRKFPLAPGIYWPGEDFYTVVVDRKKYHLNEAEKIAREILARTDREKAIRRIEKAINWCYEKRLKREKRAEEILLKQKDALEELIGIACLEALQKAGEEKAENLLEQVIIEALKEALKKFGHVAWIVVKNIPNFYLIPYPKFRFSSTVFWPGKYSYEIIEVRKYPYRLYNLECDTCSTRIARIILEDCSGYPLKVKKALRKIEIAYNWFRKIAETWKLKF